jgi:putative ABC transport system substrate-binding protein
MLRELGYIENKNIAFEYRYTDGKVERLAALADELVRLKVDLLLTSSTPEVLAVKNATTTIPIVFYMGVDPVAAGLVHSLRQPGGNVTGITLISPLLATKRLELLKEILPKVSRVGMLWDQESGSAQEWQQSQATARELGVQLISMEIATADQIEGAFRHAMKSGVGALSVTRSSLINRNQKRITELAAKHHLPAIYARADFTDSGGLIAYGATQPEAYKRVAVIVDKILKGAKPADLPVEQPTKFELVINLKTAKQIGLTIPPNVLARADRVIR